LETAREFEKYVFGTATEAAVKPDFSVEAMQSDEFPAVN
jgi:hypothetical protein